ncbi:MAG: MFS transporter [Pseudomonadota bacterium]
MRRHESAVQPLPYWRLSSFYVFHFAILGVAIPYWGLMLKGRGFDAQSIGELIAIPLAAKIVAPNIWGWLCDRVEHRISLIRLGAFCSVLAFVGLFWVQTFWLMAAVMLIYGFFWNANLPQFEALTFQYLRDQAALYARIRVWGSVGFMLAVICLGWLIDLYGSEIVLWAVMGLFFFLWISTLTVAEPPAVPHPPDAVTLSELLRRPVVWAFLAAIFLLQTSHGPYYTFYTIYLEDYGYSKTLIGQLWALGILAEIVLFWGAHYALRRWSVRRLLITSFALTALRWVMIACWPEFLPNLILAQLLNAASFGLFHVSAIHWVQHYFPGRLQGRGQALYSSMCFGAGGAVGSLSSGYLWDGLGGQLTFLLAIVLPLMAAVLIGAGMRAADMPTYGTR